MSVKQRRENRQPLAVSPSGDQFVVSLTPPQGSQFYMRSMDELDLNPIPGTEGATTSFFSPDGRELGFTLDDMLHKISLDGGTATKLCRDQWGCGAWTRDGRIVYTESYAKGLSIVSDSGGEPQTLTKPDLEHNELGHWWPQVMPGDNWVIYSGYSSPVENTRIMAFSLETGEQRLLVEGAAFGRWSPTGHLVFFRYGKLPACFCGKHPT